MHLACLSATAARTDLVASMSRMGLPYDHAVRESFFGPQKQERTHHERLDDREQARAMIFDYIGGI